MSLLIARRQLAGVLARIMAWRLNMWDWTTPAGLFRAAALLASIGMPLQPVAGYQPSRTPPSCSATSGYSTARTPTLSAASNVLVRDGKIEKISTADIAATGQVIDGGGRVLMPGLIDAHWHAMLVRPTPMRGSCERHRL